MYRRNDIKGKKCFMNKEKLYIEHELKSRSENIIWSLISTETGLQKWIADNVVEADGKMTFMWGEEWDIHEKRTSVIVERVKNSHIRFHWDDEDDEAYWEMRMAYSDLTNDYILQITDFAVADDMDVLRSIWDHNFEALHRSTGL